jgi:type II secretory pathway pseudopilin PulG
MAWETIPAPGSPSYPSPNPYVLGNALSNLVGNYQQAQQGQQQIQLNNLRQQQDQQLLDQSKAFAGGVPMNPNGTPNYSAIMKTLAEKGDINAISTLSPLIQQQQNLQGANAPDPILGGGASSSGGYGSGASSSTVDTLASNIASRIETKGQSDPYDALGPVTASGDRAYGKYQVMGDNIPAWTKEVLGVEMTPDEFLADPKAQDEVARAKLGQFLKQTGSPQDAASMWFTGKPLAQGANRTDQNGVSGAQYASIATAGMGGAPTQVASLGDSDALAYATPDTPAVPPVSAAAGSTIPRADSRDSTPKGAVGGAPAAATPPQWAANGPAWAGINAALPVGPSGAAAPAPAVRASAPQALASPSQGTVASIASTAGVPPLVAANIAKAVGVAPGAPLTPQQELTRLIHDGGVWGLTAVA